MFTTIAAYCAKADCIQTWSQALLAAPDTCATPGDERQPIHFEGCGTYNAVDYPGANGLTIVYYDVATGQLAAEAFLIDGGLSCVGSPPFSTMTPLVQQCPQIRCEGGIQGGIEGGMDGGGEGGTDGGLEGGGAPDATAGP